MLWHPITLFAQTELRFPQVSSPLPALGRSTAQTQGPILRGNEPVHQSGRPRAELVETAAQPKVALRVTWGGGQARSWAGTMSWFNAAGQQETVWQNLRLLSIDKEAPGQALIDSVEKCLRIQNRQPTTYSSFQVEVPLDWDAEIRINLENQGTQHPFVQASAELTKILNQGWSTSVDASGNGVWIERVAEDRLRFEFPEPFQIVSPGDSIEISLLGVATGLRAQTVVDWSVDLQAVPVNGTEYRESGSQWSQSGKATITEQGNVPRQGPWQISAPADPGVYELVARVRYDKSGVLPFAGRQEMVRKYQFVVMRLQGYEIAPVPVAQAERKTHSITPEQLAASWGRLPDMARINMFPRLGPLAKSYPTPFPTTGSETLEVKKEGDQSWFELGPGQWRTIEVSHLAPGFYWLKTHFRNPELGRLAVTVIQPDAAGEFAPLHTGMGVLNDQFLGVPWSDEPNGEIRQPIWINGSGAPMTVQVVLQNPGDHPVGVSRLELVPLPGHDSPGVESRRNRKGRRTGLYLQTPLLPTVFHAPKTLAKDRVPSLNDWTTAWVAAERLIQWMQQEELDHVWLPVLCQGGSLFESQLYRTSMRYENSGFSTVYQTQGKLDLVELMLRRLSGTGLTMTPVLDFSGTLELVERRALEPDAIANWQIADSRPIRYNPLNPMVQDAISQMVVDFVHRYRSHPEADGIAIILGHESHLMCVSEIQGLEDLALFQRFLRDSRLVWPQQELGVVDQSQFEQRARWTLEHHRQLWLQWRANQITQFLYRVGQQAKQAAGRPDFRVTLLAENWLAHPAIHPFAYPNLRTSIDWSQEALRLGMDLVALTAPGQPFRMKFQWGSSPEGKLDRRRASSFSFHQEQAWRLQKSLPLAAPVFHDALEVLNLESVSLAGEKHTGMQSLISYVKPTGRAKYWSESLWRNDCQELDRASWSAGAGRTDQERRFQQAFHCLPEVEFRTVRDDANCSVVIRQAESDGRYLIYLVNAAPWSVTLETEQWREGNVWRVLSPDDEGAPRLQQQTETGICHMPPHSLMVLESGSEIEQNRIVIRDQEGVSDALSTVKESLFRKLKSAGQARSLPFLTNGGFEASETQVVDWTTSQGDQQQIELESQFSHSGSRSLHIANRNGVAWIRSAPMQAVETGRVSVAAWLRVHPDSDGRSLRISIDGQTVSGQKYYRFAEITLDPQQNANGWQPVAAHFDDLPEEGMDHYRIGFDVMEPAEFWVDSVHCFDRWFDANDQKVLSNRLGLLAYALEQRPNSYGAYQMLNDYWLNFLNHFVADPQLPEQQSAGENDPSELPAWGTRLKRRLFYLR